MRLVCVLHSDDHRTCVTVHMVHVQRTHSAQVGTKFIVRTHGLSPGIYGFHVHEKGNLTNGCTSLGAHYNPDGFPHGTLNQARRHRGDLGNLVVRDFVGQTQFISWRLTVDQLLGRSLVIHRQEDDLGMLDNKGSRATGNSGGRLCCGVIGYE